MWLMAVLGAAHLLGTGFGRDAADTIKAGMLEAAGTIKAGMSEAAGKKAEKVSGRMMWTGGIMGISIAVGLVGAAWVGGHGKGR